MKSNKNLPLWTDKLLILNQFITSLIFQLLKTDHWQFVIQKYVGKLESKQLQIYIVLRNTY